MWKFQKFFFFLNCAHMYQFRPQQDKTEMRQSQKKEKYTELECFKQYKTKTHKRYWNSVS